MSKARLIALSLLLCMLLSCRKESASQDAAEDQQFHQQDPIATQALFPVSSNHKIGYINVRGEIVIEPSYSRGSVFSEGVASVQAEFRGKYGYIDRAGKFVIPPRFNFAEDFSDALARVRVAIDDSGVTTRWGYIDQTGEMVIAPQFFHAYDFSEGLARVSVGCTGQAFIDKTGRNALKAVFLNADDFSEGLAAVEVSEGWGYIDKSGSIAIEPRFDDAESFSEGLAAVKVNGKWGFSDTSGKLVVDPVYDYAGAFSEGVACVNVGGRNVRGMYPDETGAWGGGKWGYVDTHGKLVIGLKTSLHRAMRFSEGRARICLSGKWGYMDRTGETAIPAKFHHAADFQNGLARVELLHPSLNPLALAYPPVDIGYIDKSGNYVWNPTY